jgi:hypothetical protein
MEQELPVIFQNLDQDKDVKAEKADIMKEALNKFLDYCECMYFGRHGRTCWLKGKFPIQVWNQHDNDLQGRQLSTNRYEGFHSRLSKSLVSSATVWALIDELVGVETASRADRYEHRQVDHADVLLGNSKKQKERSIWKARE